MNANATKYRTSDGSPLTPSEVARLDEIEARLGDSDEIPETSDDAWATAVRGKHAKAMEAAISIRLDAEVMAWLRSKGPDYSTEINRILREKMAAETVA
jgi:uncharacterized protein (DUF4415 family)